MDIPENEQELFSANDKTQIVKALGIDVTAKTNSLHIYVNGKDIMKNILLDDLLITITKIPAVTQK